MVTTIQVSDQTKILLKVLKESEHASSYDEVIRAHVIKKVPSKKSMFGSAPYLKKYLKPYKHEKWIHDE